MFTKLHRHLTKNNVLVYEQFGFRPNSYTEKATNRLLDQILTALNVGHNVVGIFCDLKKRPLIVLITRFFCINLNFTVFRVSYIN
jgi:hypothetical protein